MADNKKYYYIKLKDSYFDKDNIKIIEAQENGYIYSLIILKLYLKSAKYEGRLMMTEGIPYSPEDVDIIARVINHDVSHVRDAIRLAERFDLISIVDTGELWMTDIQNFIGESSTEADRIRLYRKELGEKCTNVQSIGCTNVQQMYEGIKYKTTPEIEIDKEREKDIKKEINTEPEIITLPALSPAAPKKQQLSNMKDDLSNHYQTLFTDIYPHTGWSDIAKERQQINTLASKTRALFKSGVPYNDTFQTADAIVKKFLAMKQAGHWKAKKPVVPSSLSTCWAEVIDGMIQDYKKEEQFNNLEYEDIPF